MARLEMPDADLASLGEAPAEGDMLFELGMMYSVGRDPAIKGNCEAARLRREIACQMSDAEIAAARRAARDWFVGHRVVERPAIAA